MQHTIILTAFIAIVTTLYNEARKYAFLLNNTTASKEYSIPKTHRITLAKNEEDVKRHEIVFIVATAFPESALNKVDFPTFGNPTIPALRDIFASIKKEEDSAHCMLAESQENVTKSTEF